MSVRQPLALYRVNELLFDNALSLSRIMPMQISPRSDDASTEESITRCSSAKFLFLSFVLFSSRHAVTVCERIALVRQLRRAIGRVSLLILAYP